MSCTRWKRSNRTSLYIYLCANGGFWSSSRSPKASLRTPPQVSWCLLVIRQLFSLPLLHLFLQLGCLLLSRLWVTAPPPLLLDPAIRYHSSDMLKLEVRAFYIHACIHSRVRHVPNRRLQHTRLKIFPSLEQDDRFVETLGKSHFWGGDITDHWSETHIFSPALRWMRGKKKKCCFIISNVMFRKKTVALSVRWMFFFFQNFLFSIILVNNNTFASNYM